MTIEQPRTYRTPSGKVRDWTDDAPSAKQLGFAESLLKQVGILDPATDERWPATAERILGRSDRLQLDEMTKGDLSKVIDAAQLFLAQESAKVERLPAEFIDTQADDPWTTPKAEAPQRIRFQGRDYVLADQ